jgi:hypothetical protein
MIKFEHNGFQIFCQRACWEIPISSITKMVFVLASTTGDANSSLYCQSLHQSHFLYSRISRDIVMWCSQSCQSLHQSHFLYSRISSDIVTWSKHKGVVPLQRWPWRFPWVFFPVLCHLQHLGWVSVWLLYIQIFLKNWVAVEINKVDHHVFTHFLLQLEPQFL